MPAPSPAALHCSGGKSSSVQSFSVLPAACLLKTAACAPAGRCQQTATSPSCGNHLLQLRSGFIFENQFLSGLSMAGLDKHLRPPHLQA